MCYLLTCEVGLLLTTCGPPAHSKASLMDPRFGPAWIAFAHSFALEKEHDQAITAYSTATRLFQGCVISPLSCRYYAHICMFSRSL